MQRALITLAFASLFSTAIHAQPCLANWDYYLPVILDNAAGQALSDFQMRVDLPLAPLISAGKLRPDAADLRVVDSLCQPLPFYIDSTLAASSNTLWIRIPGIGAGKQYKFRIYYGRPQAQNSAASGDDTFIFFDDFEAPAVDPDKWEAIGAYATWQQSGGEMTYASDYNSTTGARFKFVRSRAFFKGPHLFDFGITQSTNANFGFGSNRDTLNRYLLRYQSGASDTMDLPAVLTDSTSNGYATVTDWPNLAVIRDQPQDLSVLVQVNAADHLLIERIGNRTTGQQVTVPFEFNYFEQDSFSFVISSFSVSFEVSLRYLKVRKPVTFPTVRILAEGFQGTPSSVPDPRTALLRVFPNPTRGLLDLRPEFRVLQWQLRDLQGRSLLSLPGSESRIDLSPLTSGLYLLEAQVPDGEPVRLLIQRS